MRKTDQRNIVTSAARTSTFTGADMYAPLGAKARFMLAVTAASGTTPTLDVVVQGKTIAGNYVAIATFAQKTAVSTESLTVDVLPDLYRVLKTIAGTTPSFTSEVDVVFETEQ